MSNKNFSVWELEKHETKDTTDSHTNGQLTVIWRDWDNIIKNHPKMVYLNSINPGEIKGPHIHRDRTSYFFCIDGSIVLIIKDEDGEFNELKADSEKPVLICIPNGVEVALVNPTLVISKVLVLADVAWKPNDSEMRNTTFENYLFN